MSCTYIPCQLCKQEIIYSGTKVFKCTKWVFVYNMTVKISRNYLHGIEFILETDQDSLQYLDNAKFINGRIMRWAMLLQQYWFTVNVINGAHNHAADYPSWVVYDVWLTVDYISIIYLDLINVMSITLGRFKHL